MKIIIIGDVAAGTSAAAKARRNDESAEIKIYDMDRDISYSVAACLTILVGKLRIVMSLCQGIPSSLKRNIMWIFSQDMKWFLKTVIK